MFENHLSTSAAYRDWHYCPGDQCAYPMPSPWGDNGVISNLWDGRNFIGQYYSVTPPVMPEVM